MGQGRRCLAGLLLSLCAVLAAAAEPPDAPSAARPVSTAEMAELRVSAPRLFSNSEVIAPPIVIESAPAPRKKVFDKKFALLAVLGAGLTVADFELTQRCLQRRTCVETDPLMPTSRAGMYVTNLPLNAALFWWGYRRREDGKRLWWLPPLTVVAAHAVGVATNVPFVGK